MDALFGRTRLNSPNIRAGNSVSPLNIWEETYKVDVLFGNKKNWSTCFLTRRTIAYIKLWMLSQNSWEYELVYSVSPRACRKVVGSEGLRWKKLLKSFKPVSTSVIFRICNGGLISGQSTSLQRKLKLQNDDWKRATLMCVTAKSGD